MKCPGATRVIVALSGGVDSAVAALRLLKAGYRVEALHMTNWESGDEYCSAGQDLADARRVCTDLDIPLHHSNFSREYRDEVFAGFLTAIRAGLTPNPDVDCNRYIKFGAFLNHARRLGADLIATGHYARVEHAPRLRLLRAADADKDQTYFLHAVDPSALAVSLFPLGDLPKPEVRKLAREHGLSNHDKPDSTGICFIGERPFRQFLQNHVRPIPGPILSAEGVILGTHAGLPFYTLGQREGLGIGGQQGADEAPWFVAGKDPRRNALLVVQGHDNPTLFSNRIRAGHLRWLAAPPAGLACGARLEARMRHRQATTPCIVSDSGRDEIEVQFMEPQRCPAPGQFVVFYAGEECLGGGAILESGLAGPALPAARDALGHSA